LRVNNIEILLQTLETQEELSDDRTIAWWPITMCHFRSSKVFRKWILIDQAYIRVDSYRLEKQFLDGWANGDAIVGRQIHQPTAGATFFRLPDVRVGNVFSVCSASYCPTSNFFIFIRHACPTRNLLYTMREYTTKDIIIGMLSPNMLCTRDVATWIARILFITREYIIESKRWCFKLSSFRGA